MSFRRVSIIGTLAAVALALLVILPVWAAVGQDVARNTDPGDVLTVSILRQGEASIIGDLDNVGPTRVGPNLYVSNIDQSGLMVGDTLRPTYNTVHVDFVVNNIADIPLDTGSGDNVVEGEDRVVRVTSDSGEPIWVNMEGDGSTLTGTFLVIEPVSSGDAPTGQIEALHGDSITITALDLRSRLTVDGEPPTFSSVAPRSGTLQSSSSINIEFTVTDDDSGLRTDAEDAATFGDDGLDDDGQRAEPLAESLGGAADIDVNWDGEDSDERRGDRNWIEEERNRSYSLSYSRADLGPEKYDWYIEAYDRVGNYDRTDASSQRNDQPYSLTVDNVAPKARHLFAGIGFDEEEGEEVKDASSILLVFINDIDGGKADSLDASTISADKFDVIGNEVIDVIHPNEKQAIDDNDTDAENTDVEHPDGTTGLLPYKDAIDTAEYDSLDDAAKAALAAEVFGDDECDSHTGYGQASGEAITDLENPTGCIDTRNRVYLVLADPVGDDDTPEIHIVGTVRDKAGNGASLTDDLEADDRISPTLTVGISGDVETDGRPLAQEEIAITVASGERLSDDPDVWLLSFDHEGTITIVDRGSISSDGTNAWKTDFEAADDDASVAAIIVHAEDRRGNTTTTAGWTDDNGDDTADLEDGNGEPDVGEMLDITKLAGAGFLVEFDTDIPFKAETDVTLNPSEEGEPLETESVNPFIELRFSEGKENTVTYTVTEGEGEDAKQVKKTTNVYTDDDDEETKFDSYGRVELSDVTLDGEDVNERIARVSSAGFDLALYDISVGDHTLEFTATDTAGNSTTKKVKFEVLPRSAYEVDLRPGWNLVSFPGEPVDSAIDSVLPADHPALEVLTYEAGLWIAAVREAGQPWEGELTDIDGQHAYWINTTSTKALAGVLISPGTGAASRPPAIPLVTGWNLIPVTDLDQAAAGQAQANYFSSLSEEDFVVAYTYDGRGRKWSRLTQTPEGDDDTVKNGQGVWVYSRSNVVLVP